MFSNFLILYVYSKANKSENIIIWKTNVVVLYKDCKQASSLCTLKIWPNTIHKISIKFGAKT